MIKLARPLIGVLVIVGVFCLCDRSPRPVGRAFREGFQKFGWTEGGNFQIRHAGCLNAKNDFGHTHRIVVKNLAPASRVQ